MRFVVVSRRSVPGSEIQTFSALPVRQCDAVITTRGATSAPLQPDEVALCDRNNPTTIGLPVAGVPPYIEKAGVAVDKIAKIRIEINENL